MSYEWVIYLCGMFFLFGYLLDTGLKENDNKFNMVLAYIAVSAAWPIIIPALIIKSFVKGWQS